MPEIHVVVPLVIVEVALPEPDGDGAPVMDPEADGDGTGLPETPVLLIHVGDVEDDGPVGGWNPEVTVGSELAGVCEVTCVLLGIEEPLSELEGPVLPGTLDGVPEGPELLDPDEGGAWFEEDAIELPGVVLDPCCEEP